VRYVQYGHALESVALLNKTYSVMQSNAMASKGLKEDLKDLEKINLQIESQWFDASKKAANTSYFYGFEEEAGVRIVEIMQGVPVVFSTLKSEKYWQIPLKMTVEGPFLNVMTYLTFIRSSPYLINFQGLNIEQVVVDKRKSAALQDDVRLTLMISCLGRTQL
jgi:hypothetical protein